MTNITENKTKTDVQMHIDKAYEIIKNNLPSNYVKKVHAKIQDPELTDGMIRNLKNRVTKYPKTKINVLNALVEVAHEYQEDLNNLQKLTN
jgi:uncharacterized protein YktB (UPF0637 family)